MIEKKAQLPHIAGYKPCYRKLEAGKSYLWCSCGLSKTQPFCDKSHLGTDMKPVRYLAKQDGEEVLFCTCKQTSDSPFCDGTHNKLRDVYENDDPNNQINRNIPLIDHDENGKAMLGGGCYVSRVEQLILQEHTNLKIGAVISSQTGARYQSLFYAEICQGESPIISFGNRDLVIISTQGKGTITISGRDFPLEIQTGIYIRPQEAVSITNPGSTPITLYISVCPVAERPEFLPQMPVNFDDAYADRIAVIDTAKRQQTANRFFQILVNKRMGTQSVTQFIGEILFSKAFPHRHLYEESLVILSGDGYIWTETYKAKVSPGDVIFLPRKLIHSLQCTAPDGMLVVGVIYPGDNPSIDY